MYRSIGNLRDYTLRIPGTEAFLLASPVTVDWLAFLEAIFVQHVDILETYDGLLIDLYLAFDGQLALPVPGLAIASIAAGNSESGYTFLRSSLRVGTTSSLRLHGLSASLRLDQEWLVPVALEPGDYVPETFEIQMRGSFDVDSAFNIAADMDSFTIPPFMIGRTGLILALHECRLALSDGDVPPEVLALGYDHTYAASSPGRPISTGGRRSPSTARPASASILRMSPSASTAPAFASSMIGSSITMRRRLLTPRSSWAICS
jgi:hypothetical protein